MKLRNFFSNIFGADLNSEKCNELYFCPTLWEDDYCQIEILSVENIEHVKSEFKQINSITESNSNEFGFDKIYGRELKKYSTIEKKIIYTELENLLSSPLIRAKRIKYENENKMLDCNEGKTKAFGINDFILFFDVKNEFINNIWIDYKDWNSNNFLQNKNAVIGILYEIGVKYNMILVDWNKLTITDLKNKEEIEKYCR